MHLRKKKRKRGTVVAKVDISIRSASRSFSNVEVRLIKKRNTYRQNDDETEDVPYNSKLFYAIYLSDLIPESEVVVTHHDPNEVVKKAEAKLTELLEIEWTDVLHVSFTGKPEDHYSEGAGYSLALTWKTCQVGKRRGEPVYRYVTGSRPDAYIREGELSSGVVDEFGDAFGDESAIVHPDAVRTVKAVIPDTEENVRSLEKVVEALCELQLRLSKLMSPKMIEKTLANLPIMQLTQGKKRK